MGRIELRRDLPQDHQLRGHQSCVRSPGVPIKNQDDVLFESVGAGTIGPTPTLFAESPEKFLKGKTGSF